MAILRKNSTVVRQYSTTGEFIAEYQSVTEAARATNINAPSISNAIWWKENRTARGYIWLLKDENIGEIIEKNHIDAEQKLLEKKKSKIGKKKKEKAIEIDWRVERVNDYIFIEKNTLCGADLCLRCAINSNGDECLPCRKEERKDGKQGYWRYSKSVHI